jgi:hypothetical protein
VPIVNTLAFLFTVIGEWSVENKVISRGARQTHEENIFPIVAVPPYLVSDYVVRKTNPSSVATVTADTMLGMLLSLSGIALCVHSKVA